MFLYFCFNKKSRILMRTEKDSLGEIQITDEALYGIHMEMQHLGHLTGGEHGSEFVDRH